MAKRRIYTGGTILESARRQYFERKSARIKPIDIVKHIIAFANAEGGVLAIGLENDGSITGSNYQGAYSLADYQKAINQNIRPLPTLSYDTLAVVDENNIEESVFIIHVEPSSDAVIYSSRDEVYLRIGDKSMKQTHTHINQLEYATGQRMFEDKILDNTTIDDVDKGLLGEYKNHIGAESLSDEQVLSARGFLKKGHLTVAGMLLFGQNTFVELPQSRLRFLRYDGIKRETGTRLNIIKDIDFEGSIPFLIRQSYTAIKAQLREFQLLGDDGQFQVVDEYPEFAWFEGTVNALVHRDYSLYGDYVRISMYDDRLEIFSPGRLPNIVTLENMRYTRYSRNPKIARTLTEFGWVRELNEGVNRIFEEMAAYYLEEPEYEEPDKNSVLLRLKNNYESRKLRLEERIDNLEHKLEEGNFTQNERKLLAYLYNNSTITVREAAEVINRGVTAARHTLKSLEEQGVIKWEGSSTNDPTQYYYM